MCDTKLLMDIATWALVGVIIIIFGVCAVASMYRSHPSVKEPLDEPVLSDWTLVRLVGFYGTGRCKCCNQPDKLHRGKCASCWIILTQALVNCDKCGRYWEPGDDDSRDICPRCRVVKVAIIPPDDMSDTEKLRKRPKPVSSDKLQEALVKSILRPGKPDGSEVVK